MEKKIGKHAFNAIFKKRQTMVVEKKTDFIESTFDEIIEKYNNIILLDNLTNQGNLGAIIRSAAICGFAVFLRERSTINEFTLKAASGGAEYTGICFVKNINETLKKLKKLNYWIIGLSEKGSKIIPTGFEKKVLVIGSEDRGISDLVKTNCDLLWQLDSKNDEFNVYNASNAAAIAMYLQMKTLI